MSGKPQDVAAMIAGIRAVRPAISAGSIEVLLLVASGIDSSADLQSAMRSNRQYVNRCLSLLTGRGRVGQRALRSDLSLVQRRRHPHRRGFALELTQNGADLVAATFGDSLQQGKSQCA
jgi:hypothetical protein